MYRPTAAELASVAAEFDLHPLAIEDAAVGHQRSKVERYGDTLFVVLRPARYDDVRERLDIGELHLFAGPDFLITIRHAESPDMASVRRRLEQQPELLALGSEAVLYAVLDRMVDEYEPVVAGIENDIDEIEDALFGDSDDDALSRRIYELSGELIRFTRATHPLVGIIEWLQRGHDVYHVDIELQRRLRDVQDHAIRVTERIDGFRAVLDKALTVHSALVARRQTEVNLQQNEQVKKISSWAAIIFAPTLIGTVYGMNFDIMPELHWEYGYPVALGSDGGISDRALPDLQAPPLALSGGSDGAVQAITRVAEAGHDVALLVEALIERTQHEGHVAVADLLLDRRDALRGAEDADRGHVLCTAREEEVDRCAQRPAGREHRVEHEALPVAEVLGQALGVGVGLQGLLVARHPEKADLGRGSSFTIPSSMPSPARRMGTTRGAARRSAPLRGRDRGLDLDLLDAHVARRLVGEEGQQLLGELPEHRRRCALVAQHGQLVGDEGMIGHVHAHAAYGAGQPSRARMLEACPYAV
jgi:magnesium transporter